MRMNGLLKPWSRRLGVATLAIALCLPLLWIRSETVRDELAWYPSYFLPDLNWYVEIVSLQGTLGLQQYQVAPGLGGIGTNSPSYFQSNQVNDYFTGSPRIEETLTWQWQWRGFGYGHAATHLTGMSAKIWTVPYWSFVIPLTLQSAWLLLSKPRSSYRKPSERREPKGP